MNKYGQTPGFTSKYNCHNLVYYELCDEMESAVLSEKQIKAGSRKKKMALVESINPKWDDLHNSKYFKHWIAAPLSRHAMSIFGEFCNKAPTAL